MIKEQKRVLCLLISLLFITSFLINHYSVSTDLKIIDNKKEMSEVSANTLQKNGLLWNTTWGGASDDRGYGVALDATGNIFCTGFTYSMGAGGADLELIKFYPNGTRAWNVTWGGSSNDYGLKVLVDAEGNIYCTGYSESFGAGGLDLALLKFYPNGTRAWNITWGGSGDEAGFGLALDSEGNLRVSGYTDTFGAGWYDFALLKFYPNGTRAWNVTWGGSLDDVGRNCALDFEGNCYVGGSMFRGSDYNFALVKFHPNGTQIWNTSWGGPAYDMSYAMALDVAGDIYCTGYTESFGRGLQDLALVKYYPNGTKAWNLTWGGSKGDYGYGIERDPMGGVCCVGYTASFGAGLNDLLLVKYYPNGTQAWNTTWGGSKNDLGYAMTMDAAENSYCTGLTTSSGTVNYDFTLVKFGIPIPSSPSLQLIQPNPTGNGIINLNWPDVPYAEIYYIYRDSQNITNVGSLTPIGTSTQSNYTDTLLIPGTYFYVVVAGNIVGNSSISTCQDVLFSPIPVAPDLLAITPNPNTNGIIKLNWTAVYNVEIYYIYRNSQNMTNVGSLTPIGTSTQSIYTDVLSVNGVYYYVVVAGNIIGNSSISNCQSVNLTISTTAIPGFELIPIIIALISIAIIYIFSKDLKSIKKKNSFLRINEKINGFSLSLI